MSPTSTRGDFEYTVHLGDRVSLPCGTQHLSNPAPSIVWHNPGGNFVVDSDSYDIINDATGLRLNIANTTNTDNGTWTCSVIVEAQNVNVPPNGRLVPVLRVGMANFAIRLAVIGKLHIIASDFFVWISGSVMF